MSNLKINEHLYLSQVELKRNNKYLAEEGYKKTLSKIGGGFYGVLDTVDDTLFENLLCEKGTGAGDITVRSGNAYDVDGNYINMPSDEVDYYTSPSDSTTRYIVIGHDTTSVEEGTVSIAANGVVTGVGTTFTEYLRGQGNVPIKVSFPDSVSNTGEYVVVSVSSDTVMQLAAPVTYTAESGKQISVVGAFTPGIQIPAGSKYIYEKDYYVLSVTTTPGATDIVLCSVWWDGVGNATITDLRKENRYELASILNDSEVVEGNFTTNHPFVAVEQILNGAINTDFMKLKVGFGFRSSTGNWTSDKLNRTLSISLGTGGTFINTITGITNNYFDGWYAYVLDASTGVVSFKSKIESSLVSGTVDLQLREFAGQDPDETGMLVVAPDCDFVEILVEDEDSPIVQSATQSRLFRPEEGYGMIDSMFPLSSGVYRVSYRLLKGKRATIRKVVNSGNYYNSNQFSYPNGTLVGSPSVTASTGGLYGPNTKTPSHIMDTAAAITLANGWTAYNTGTYGSPTVLYDRVTGMVSLHGVLDGSAATGQVASAVLISTNYKPWHGVRQVYNVRTLLSGTNATFLYVDGTATIFIDSFGSATDIYSLNGISWYVGKDLYNI